MRRHRSCLRWKRHSLRWSRILANIEVVVANAGITRDTLLLQMSDEDWDQVIATNLTGAFRVARRAARPMIRARSARIVFISSVVGQLGSAGQVNYAASKAGLVGMALLAGARARLARRDSKCRGAWIHRDRHDG